MRDLTIRILAMGLPLGFSAIQDLDPVDFSSGIVRSHTGNIRPVKFNL